MALTQHLPAHRDDMLFERAPGSQPALGPQHLGEFEHRGQRFVMLIAQSAAQLVDALLALAPGWLVAHPPTLPPKALPDKSVLVPNQIASRRSQ